MTPFTQHLRSSRRFFPLVLLVFALAAGTPPLAAAPPSSVPARTYDIPAANAFVALGEFATQSGEELVYSADAVEGIKTNPVKGAYAPVEALRRMLAGTGLVISQDERSGALAVGNRSALKPVAGHAAPRPAREPADEPAGMPATVGYVSQANEDVIALTPFEVQSDRDNSYGALQSNSLSVFAMDLQRMPATAEVFTQTFIDDTNSDTIEDMLINYSGIVGYSPGDSSAYTESSGDRDGGGGLSLRGFSATPIKVDGFFGPPSSTRSAGGSTPTFMVERVEVVEGPQSLLYGAIGAGGVINAVYKRAEFGVNRGSVRYGVNDLGGKSATVDADAGTGRVAVRFVATNQDNPAVRQNLGHATEGYYLQAAIRLGSSTLIRLINNRYETLATNGFNPSLKPFLAADSPLANDTTQYLAVTRQIPAGIFGGAVNWNNVDSFAGSWGSEPSTITNNSLEVESKLAPWLSVKAVAIYDDYQDWRNTTALTLEPVGVSNNPYSTPAIMLSSPNLNFQSQRQKAVQFSLLATNDFFQGTAHAQTLLGGYLNHVGPSFGSSGITYAYIQADSNWNPVIGANTADYGHLLMPSQFIPIADGQIVRYPVFNPGAPRATLAGVNYILQPRIVQSAADKGLALPGDPSNPYGLVPNGAANLANTPPGGNFTFSGAFNPGAEEHEHYLNFANYTDWLGGKIQTLAGVSFDRATTQNLGANFVVVVPWRTYFGYQFGAIYQVLPVLGFYATLGTAATPVGSTSDLEGRPLATPKAKAPVPELGLKAHTRDQRYSAQLAWDVATKDKDEIQSVDGSYQNAVNPNGINGREGGLAANNFVNIDHSATSLEFVATANPSPVWRLRFSMNYLFAQVLDAVNYHQVYNDQFYTNTAGQVTYANGAVVYVDGSATSAASAALSTATAAGAVPLSLATINNSSPANPYYASPDPTSGSITNAALKTILGTVDPVNGPIRTGATGLPLSAMQYAFVSPFPNATVPIFTAGNPTSGFPGWQWNASADFTLPRGPLRGLGLYLDGAVQYSTRAYYTFYPGSGAAGGLVVNERRVLTVLPTIANFKIGLHYAARIDRFRCTTRLLVNNAFDHDPFYVLPQAANGNFLQATQRVPPRLWTWTNEIDF